MDLPDSVEYEFGPYRIDARERLLRRGDELVPLPPKVAGTLLVLVGSAGRMVEKGDLIKAVWPDTFVEEGALTRNISLLRKTLGDTGDEPVYIETIPKRGYRFIAPVHPAQAPAQHAAEGGDTPLAAAVPQEEPTPEAAASIGASLKWIALVAVLAAAGVLAVFRFHLIPANPGSAQAVTRPAESVLAVLPFSSLDKDASRDYFAAGITQALITGLTKLGGLRVVSFASESNPGNQSDVLKAVRRDPSINRVLTGTVLRSADRVRIDAQLVDPRSRSVLWANFYERDVKDIVALESAVAEAIATEVQVTVTVTDRQRLRKQGQVDPRALDASLRGRYFWNRRTEEGLRKAVEYFKQAIAADDRYAPAYSGLADSYALLGSIGVDGMSPRQAMPMAKAAAEKALELDPELADAHTSLAYVKLSYDWDLPGAGKEFSRALELNPASATAHHWYSHYFMASADLEKAREQMQAAYRLEPLSPSINIGVGWCYYYSKQYDKAIEQYRSVTDIDPTFPMAHQTLGMAYQQLGNNDQAIEEFKRAAAFSNNSPASVAALASAYAGADRPAEARRELARLEEMARHRYVPPFYFATVHYALGDLPKTFSWGWKAVGDRCDYLMYLRVEPRVGKLAGNPEFIRILGLLHP